MHEKRFKNCATPRNFYAKYLEMNPKGTPHYCDYETYSQIVKLTLKKFKDYLIYDAGIMNLPYRLGRIAVSKRKRSLKRLPIDWALTKELGTRVVTFNDHSQGYRYKVYWNKKAAVVKNKAYYSFYFVRDANRELAKAIKENITDYFQFL